MALLWALVGLAVGPLLNLLIYRLPRLERLTAPVECPHCHVRRPLWAQSALLASLLGYRGRCGGCGKPPERYAVAVELAAGVAFWLLYPRFGSSPMLLLASLYSCILLVVFVIDWQHRLILNRVTYPSILLAVLLTPLVAEVPLAMTLLGLAVGGVTFALVYAFGYLLYRQEVLGLGDVKLAMLLGAMLGFPAIMVMLLLGSLVGAAGASVLMFGRRRSGRDFMPYGTAMCLGAFATFFVTIPSF